MIDGGRYIVNLNELCARQDYANPSRRRSTLLYKILQFDQSMLRFIQYHRDKTNLSHAWPSIVPSEAMGPWDRHREGLRIPSKAIGGHAWFRLVLSV